MAQDPNTLQQAILFFADPDNCLNYLAVRRWPKGVICPTCGSKEVRFLAPRRVWCCKTRHPKWQFSVKVGTIFEESPIGLDKWLTAMWMMGNCKNGVSSWEIHRAIGVTQKTAWFMLHRIRLATQDPNTGGKLSGEIEVDETFVGAKARFMHKDKKLARRGGRRIAPGPHGKTIIAAVLERGSENAASKVRAMVVEKRRKKNLQALVRDNVEAGSALYSDALQSYDGLKADYLHQVIDHAEAYVDGQVHTNGLENFWSLLKRGLHGTYVSVEPFHLFRYVDEQAFRFNNRKDMNDGERSSLLVSQVVGKRLTFAELTGKVGEKPALAN